MSTVLGKLGPGIGWEHVQGAQRLADIIHAPIVIHGSRQSGTSCHTGEPFRPDSDVDLGIVGDPSLLLAAVDAWEQAQIPDVKHCPMWAFTTVEEALERNCVVVRPSKG